MTIFTQYSIDIRAFLVQSYLPFSFYYLFLLLCITLSLYFILYRAYLVVKKI